MNPLDVARAFRHRAECVSCKQNGLTIIESRKSGKTIRRRKQCMYCKYRETTYELTQAEYLYLTNIETIYKNIKKLIDETKNPEKTCDHCSHMTKSGCAFEFPEAGGTFAKECSMYENTTSALRKY